MSMSMLNKKNFVLATAAAWAFLSVLAMGQTPAGDATATAKIPLQPYTAPDQSASAGVPAGWKVTMGGNTVVVMSGPNGETIFLGTTVVARNGPFSLGQRAMGGVDMSMPNAANLPQKLTMVMQNNASLNGTQPIQVNITSATPIQVPAALGQCGRLAGTFTNSKGTMTMGILMCSLPLDSGGTYKVIMKLAQAPASVAAQERATAAAVFASYRVSPEMLRRKLAPHTAAPIMPAGGMVMPMPMPMAPGGVSMPSDPTNSDCFDLIMMRETPRYQLPRHCGGTAPD